MYSDTSPFSIPWFEVCQSNNDKYARKLKFCSVCPSHCAFPDMIWPNQLRCFF
jgi:hypothetical protein